MLIFVSLAFWSWLYVQCKAAWPDKCPEYYSRTVTLLHGSIGTVVGLWLCGRPSMERCAMTIGPMHYALMTWSWGYFAFDLIWCLVYWPNNWLMLCHHGCALGGVSMYLGKPNSGCTFPCSLAFLEITNPLLQLRWFLRDSNRDDTIFYVGVEVAYLILFLGLRGVLGTYLIYKIFHATEFQMEEKVVSLILYIVSMTLIYEVAGYALYKYKTKIDEFQGFVVEIGNILNNQT